jgi:hypothetical protein
MNPEDALAYMEDRWNAAYREYQEYMDRVYDDGGSVVASAVPTQTPTNTDEGLDDDALIRLGINTRPRPETVGLTTLDATTTVFQGQSDWTMVNANVTDTLIVEGNMRYNGEELQDLIRRLVREELQQQRREEQ